MKIATLILNTVSALILVLVGPGLLGTYFPRQVGYIEGYIDRGVTPEGRCRLDNPCETIRRGGQWLVMGYVMDPVRGEMPHVWGLDREEGVVDVTCPLSNEFCRNRRAFAYVLVDKSNKQTKLAATVSGIGEAENRLLSKNVPLIDGILRGQGLI